MFLPITFTEDNLGLHTYTIVNRNQVPYGSHVLISATVENARSVSCIHHLGTNYASEIKPRDGTTPASCLYIEVATTGSPSSYLLEERSRGSYTEAGL